MFVSRPETFTAEERDRARFMPLDGAPISPAAQELTGQLAMELFRASGGGKRERPGKPYTAAVGALISDLLRNAVKEPAGWGHFSLRREAFSYQRVGYRVCKAAFDAMAHQGMLEAVLGHRQYEHFGGSRVPSWSKSTRARGTKGLFERTSAAGITPANHNDHFELIPRVEPKVVKDPLECRTSSLRFADTKVKGDALPLDLTDPAVRRLHDQVAALNTYFARQEIAGADHRGFRRIFNEGGGSEYGWDKGGRLYSIGGGYQAAKKNIRAAMTINGEPVAELDITASHLTILHALRGEPFDPAADPYAIEPLPRDVVKAWVTMTLGHDRLHRRWPKAVKERFEPDLTRPMNEVYPLRKTQELILERIPILRDWESSAVRWVDLQFVESSAVIKTVDTLGFEHDVPCLPVHDSIIIPISKKELAASVLKAAFRSVVGVEPHLKEA